MASGKESIIEKRRGRRNSVRHWPCATSFSEAREKLSLDSLHAYQRRGIFTVLKQYILKIIIICFIGLILWLAWYIPYWFPEWHFFQWSAKKLEFGILTYESVC